MTQTEQIVWHKFDCDNPPVDGTYLLSYLVDVNVDDEHPLFMKITAQIDKSDNKWILYYMDGINDVLVSPNNIMAYADMPEGWQDDTN